MENTESQRTFIDTKIEIERYKNNTWKALMRQCMITGGICCVYFLEGLFLGAPTMLVAEIRADVNSTEIISDEMLSWLTTAPVISSAPFVVILPLLLNFIGRKLTFLFVWFCAIIGFIIFYNSTNIYHVLISEVFAGAISASTITISPVIISEYTSPKYRGIFLTLKGATAFWGIWISNAIGTYFHWKNIAVISFICSVYVISVLMWPESPYWLAKRGRYEESVKSHRWLKGFSENSEKELTELITTHKNYNKAPSENHNAIFPALSKMWSIITSRPFYKPALISIILISQYQFTGKFVITMYAIEALKHLSPNQSFVNKTMLILDGVTVFSMYVGCIISQYYKRRTLLLLFSGTGTTLLYILSLYLYLASLSIVTLNDIVILLLFTVFSIAIACGPMILCTSIYGEIMPPRYQNTAMIVVGAASITTISVLLKVSPLMFKSFKMHGCFLFYAIASTVLLTLLWFHLPETKDKTIQEIEKLFTTNQMITEQNTIANRIVELDNLIK